jgi:ribonuclease P/MRP protein subunit RPP40
MFLDRITRIVDEGNNVDVIYLDLAKAFDRVPHQRLLMKLKQHGITGKLLKWIESWLSNRRQRVCIRGAASHWIPITSSVPQGSVLGPLLFLIYVNDLDCSILNWILKFADDTKVFSQVSSLEQHLRLQTDLNTLFKWSINWQMDFNVDKCVVLHVGDKGTQYSYHEW